MILNISKGSNKAVRSGKFELYNGYVIISN